MAGSKEPALAELFLGERPGAGDPAVLEAQLQEIVDKAKRVWSDLAIDPARLVVQLARVIGDDVAQGLSELYAADFALGLACVDQVPGALTQLDRLCGPVIDTAVARIDRSPELRDEVRQTLWQRLFVGTPDQAPRMLSYAGRGPLAGWVAVAAQRIALDMRRAATRAGGSDPDVDQLLPTDDHPEVDYMRMRYKTEFEDAVRDALAALPDRDRLLLRLTAVSGLSHEQIANIYKVNQSTVSRWIARARADVLEATERNVCSKLGVKRDEFLSLAGLLVSRIDLSISRVLETSTTE
jgi:RNA polymerase sigma-70 factor (ECF subfamily)